MVPSKPQDEDPFLKRKLEADTEKVLAEKAKLIAETRLLEERERETLLIEKRKGDAEAEKLIAERKKIDSEVDQLGKPFLHRPEVLTLVGVLASAFLGFLGGVYKQDIANRERQVEAREKEIADRTKELDGHKTSIDELQKQKVKLTETLGGFVSQTWAADRALTEQRTALKGQQEQLEKLRKEKEQFDETRKYRIVDAFLDTAEQQLVQIGSESNVNFDVELDNLSSKKMLEEKALWIDRIAERARRASTKMRLRVELYRALREHGEGEDKIKFTHELIRLIAKDYFAGGRGQDQVRAREILDYAAEDILSDDVSKKLLVDLMWQVDLKGGSKEALEAAAPTRVARFIYMSRPVLAASPDIHITMTLFLKNAFVAAPLGATKLRYASALATVSPQCYIMLWHFGPNKGGMRSDPEYRRIRDSAVERLWVKGKNDDSIASDLPPPIGPLPETTGFLQIDPDKEAAWAKSHPLLMKFWLDDKQFELIQPSLAYKTSKWYRITENDLLLRQVPTY
jgi:hypothetical protein